MKIGIMAGSLEADTKYAEIDETMMCLLSSIDATYVMGPNETGVMRTIKDKIREEYASLLVVTTRNTPSYSKIRSSEKMIVSSIIERTEKLYENSDLVLFFPGGIGTRTEFYTMLDINMEENRKKPLILYNFHHDFDFLLEDFHQMVEKKFITDDFMKENYFTVVETKEELLEEIKKRKDDKNE